MKVRVVKDHFCGTGWRAEPETLYLGGVGAVYVEKLEFELPEEWDGLAVTLHIEQEGGTVPHPAREICVLPDAGKRRGNWRRRTGDAAAVSIFTAGA